MRKRIMVMILVAMMLVMTTGCGSDTKKLENKIDSIAEKLDSQSREAELQKQLDEANKQISNLKQQIDSNSASGGFINIKFWQDAKKYKAYYDEEFQFYSDCFCSQPITDVVIISPIIDEVELSNEMKVYAVMSDKGIVYSTNWPELDEIEETTE